MALLEQQSQELVGSKRFAELVKLFKEGKVNIQKDKNKYSDKEKKVLYNIEEIVEYSLRLWSSSPRASYIIRHAMQAIPNTMQSLIITSTLHLPQSVYNMASTMDCDEFHSDFCPACGGLIELETINENIHCQICGSELSFH